MFFLFYLALGASVFSAIEAPIEKAELQELFQKRQDFLRKYPCLDGKGATVSKASCVYRLSASICFSLKRLFLHSPRIDCAATLDKLESFSTFYQLMN